MIVVADTTPLDHLILVEHVNLLKALYGRVIIPQAVLSELQDQATPARVNQWISNRPDWLEVKHATFPPDPSLAQLDVGCGGIAQSYLDSLPANIREGSLGRLRNMIREKLRPQLDEIDGIVKGILK